MVRVFVPAISSRMPVHYLNSASTWLGCWFLFLFCPKLARDLLSALVHHKFNNKLLFEPHITNSCKSQNRSIYNQHNSSCGGLICPWCPLISTFTSLLQSVDNLWICSRWKQGGYDLDSRPCCLFSNNCPIIYPFMQWPCCPLPPLWRNDFPTWVWWQSIKKNSALSSLIHYIF